MSQESVEKAAFSAHMERWNRSPIVLSGIFLSIAVVISLVTGKYNVSLREIVLVLSAKLTGTPSGLSPTIDTVIWQVRLPRVAAGVAWFWSGQRRS
jgi:iron complex transport system permease protein